MSNTSPSLVDLAENPLNFLKKVIGSSSDKGCLQVAFQKGIDWQIYIENEKLLSATSTLQTVQTVQMYLQSCGPTAKEALNYIKSLSITDKKAATLMQDQKFKSLLDLGTYSKLHWALSKDAYESMLWVPTAQCVFWKISLLPDGLQVDPGSDDTFSLSNLTRYYQERLKVWQTLTSTFNSPHQRLYIFDYHNVMHTAVEDGKISAQVYETLKRLLRGLSLRRISLLLKQDELKVAKFLQPYIEAGAIVLRDPESPLDQCPKLPVIQVPQGIKQSQPAAAVPAKPVKANVVCIDDSLSMLDEMERLLTPEGYGVTKINDPLKASAQLFRIKPDIILMDVTMPGIDGNQLCKVLRESELFQETPIVMVTGNQGILNRAKSKFSGATDYITKPFDREKLIGIVEKYLLEKVPG